MTATLSSQLFVLRRSVWWSRGGSAACSSSSLLLGGACRNSTPAITYDPTTVPASTTTVPPATTASAGVDGPASSLATVTAGEAWVDATANLTGMESYCGNLSFVSAHPHRDLVFAGVAGQGLFSSAPGSSEWIPFGRGAESAPLNHRTSSFVYDPDDPLRFWESGYFGLGRATRRVCRQREPYG